MMRYPLFLCDFDGTLVCDDGTVNKENIEAIARYQRAGGRFVIVTGRMLASIRQRLRELGLYDGVVVAYQGALIADIATGEILMDASSPYGELLPALKFMEERGYNIQIYVRDTLYSSRGGALFEMYERVCRVKGHILTEPPSVFLEREKLPVTKALAICEPADREEILTALTERFGEEFFVADSAPYLVEIIPKNCSKGAAVRFLSGYYGVPPARIAAIGDRGTDLPMVEAAGGKFAVGNAVEELKRIARVVPNVENSGVAAALQIAMEES